MELVGSQKGNMAQTVITQLSSVETADFLQRSLVKNRLGEKMLKLFKSRGWTIHDYHMEKKYKGFFLVIEFCVGDFCTHIGSKNNGYVLEEKIINETLEQALVTIGHYQLRIDAGEGWIGEND